MWTRDAPGMLVCRRRRQSGGVPDNPEELFRVVRRTSQNLITAVRAVKAAEQTDEGLGRRLLARKSRPARRLGAGDYGVRPVASGWWWPEPSTRRCGS